MEGVIEKAEAWFGAIRPASPIAPFVEVLFA
jgi:hypothetical protein